MKQVTIFDYISSNIKEKIINKLEKYCIDKVYRDLEEGTYTLLEINKLLSKNINFTNYLNELSEELKRYLIESDVYKDFIDKKQYSSFMKRKNCIIVYNYRESSVGPIYCAEMLKNSLFEKE